MRSEVELRGGRVRVEGILVQLWRRLIADLEAVELARRHALRGALDLHVDVLRRLRRSQEILGRLVVAERLRLETTVVIVIAQLIEHRRLHQRMPDLAANYVLVLAVV